MRGRPSNRVFLLGLVLVVGGCPGVVAAAGAAPLPSMPSFEEILSVLTLRHYNTRLVVLSTMLLGLAAGLTGTFLLLRQRSLMGDVLSHAALPGIGLAFLFMVAWGGAGKSLVGLLLGAALTGLLGTALVLAIRNSTRVKDDTAMGIVLSVFYGIGVALLGMAQTVADASAAGLESFIYGKAASIIWQDFLLMAGVTGAVTGFFLLLHKELTLLCFDEHFAAAQGWPVGALDLLLLTLVVAVTVVGLQSVGLILIVAFLITPAAAARFWTHDLRRTLWFAAGIGAVSGWLGASLSALIPDLPAGAIIVLVTALAFLISLLLGPARGLLARLLKQRRLRRRVGRQHLLRGVYEILERASRADRPVLSNLPVRFEELLTRRSWSPAYLRRLIRRAGREGHLETWDGQSLRLSEAGFGEALRITRNHRLWELYLIRHADVAPQHVDRDADAVEHVLGAELVRQLEAELPQSREVMRIPPSPHTVEVPG